MWREYLHIRELLCDLKKKSTEMMGGTCEEISARKIKEEMK